MNGPASLDVMLGDLVHPASRTRLRRDGARLLSERGEAVALAGEVPVFLPTLDLTPHQRSELENTVQYLAGVRSGGNPHYPADKPHLAPRVCWEWSLPWINPTTVKRDTRIVCFGGSFTDDLPHVESDHKYNLDHLAHAYLQLVPEIASGGSHFVAAEAEAFPFPDGWADFVYTRNSLDHVCNPIRTIQEAWRVLRPGGLLLVAVYYNSTFVNEHESTVIDDEFLERCVHPLFEIVSQRIVDMPAQALPSWRRTGFVQIVAQKRADGQLDLAPSQIAATTTMLSAFHSALYLDGRGRHADALPHHCEVLRHQPVFTADVNRLLYSFIRVTAFTDHLKFAFVGALLRSFGAHPTWLAIHAQAARDLGVPEGLPVPPGAWSSLHDALGFPGVIEGSRLLYCLALASWQAGTFSQAAGAMEAAMRGEPPPVI